MSADGKLNLTRRLKC